MRQEGATAAGRRRPKGRTNRDLPMTLVLAGRLVIVLAPRGRC